MNALGCWFEGLLNVVAAEVEVYVWLDLILFLVLMWGMVKSLYEVEGI
jgi:hypothetical protein